MHDQLIHSAAEHYRKIGYTVYGTKQAKEIMTRYGFDPGKIGEPDLIIEKDKTLTAVEVCVNFGDGFQFYEKIRRYRQLGQVVLMFPMNIEKVFFLGVEPNFDTEIWSKAK